MSIYSDCSEISGKHKVQGVKNVTLPLGYKKKFSIIFQYPKEGNEIFILFFTIRKRKK